ncbi:MAG: VCBS repeat-containing protein [Nitrospinota bacterium]
MPGMAWPSPGRQGPGWGLMRSALLLCLVIPPGAAGETGDRFDPPETHRAARLALPGSRPRWLFAAPAPRPSAGRRWILLVLAEDGSFHVPRLGGGNARQPLSWERQPIPTDLTVEAPPADLGGGRLAGAGREGFFIVVNAVQREWRFVRPSEPLSLLARAVGLASDTVAAVGKDGSLLLFREGGSGWRETQRLAPGSAELPSPALPDAVLAAADLDGDGRKELVVPVAPSPRYRHGVLGDAIEPTELRAFRVEEGKLRFLASFPAGGDRVFEALGAIAADLDGDRREELLLTRSDAQGGAAHLVLGLEKGMLEVKAQGRPAGGSNRWSHLLGAFDVDSSGMKLLAVETPHLSGSLIALRMRGGELRERARRPGFTTHTIGSRNLWQFALLRRGGLTEVVLQDRDRNRLVGLALLGNRWKVRWTLPLPSPVLSNIEAGDFDGDGQEDLALADGAGSLLSSSFPAARVQPRASQPLRKPSLGRMSADFSLKLFKNSKSILNHPGPLPIGWM